MLESLVNLSRLALLIVTQLHPPSLSDSARMQKTELVAMQWKK